MAKKVFSIIHKTRLSIQIEQLGNFAMENIKIKGDDAFMSINMTTTDYPYVLTREQASRFLGIDPKSFDKYIRSHDDLERFMVGRQERYTMKSLTSFIEARSI